MKHLLDFEKPLYELETRIEEISLIGKSNGVDISIELNQLDEKINDFLGKTYSALTPWQKVQVARHPSRPNISNYLDYLIKDFIPLKGDRNFGDDKAITGGMGRFDKYAIMFIGHNKGLSLKDRPQHNFGMAKPEGYRKAIRLFKLADRFQLPIITIIDTPGAYPGIEAEARGQAQAIASMLDTCLNVSVPIISVIIGEGGSGGAIALAAADYIIMLEHSIYSVISPEGCASILWRSAEKAEEAAAALKLTAQDLKNLNIIDHIVEEPIGGAHRNPQETVKKLGDTLLKTCHQIYSSDWQQLKEKRHDKFIHLK